MYDIIIIGGGPAGLTAALYALRASKKVLIIEKGGFGGQITFSPKVENFPGDISISGSELADRLVEQVLTQGAEVELANVTGIIDNTTYKTVKTENGSFECSAVIIATGAKHRMLGLPGEEKLVGEGISFCAVCDGAFYRGKDTAVIGGGNTALQDALLLSEGCRSVTMIQNLPFLTGEKKLIEQLERHGNISVLYESAVIGLEEKNGSLSGIRLRSTSGKESLLHVDAMFVAIGLIPANEAFSDLIDLNENGYIISGEDTLSNVPGIFAAGDCRTKSVRQVTTACADGAVAALSAVNYIDQNINKLRREL